MTLVSHKKLPPSQLSSVVQKNKGKYHMKSRKIELCSLKGCIHYMQPQTDLTRHLKNCHAGMTKREYYAKSKPDVCIEDQPFSSFSQSQSLGPAVTELDIFGKDASDSEKVNQNLTSDEKSDGERSVLDSDVSLSSPFYPGIISPSPKKDLDITRVSRRVILPEL
ncbi:uncharacterized protein [Clytia hemisphaerica]|uniref:Uncharacterized protein n=1 Tax=Clytia hemisphaerica TaxID=252671 RepID=A0A7M5V3G8_9CNID